MQLPCLKNQFWEVCKSGKTSTQIAVNKIYHHDLSMETNLNFYQPKFLLPIFPDGFSLPGVRSTTKSSTSGRRLNRWEKTHQGAGGKVALKKHGERDVYFWVKHLKRFAK